VLVSATEYGVDDVSAPGHLKRLEALDLFVGRLDSMSLGGLVVVHDHGVDVQFDDFGAGYCEPPEKKLQKQAPKKVSPMWGKSPVESFDGVRGDQALQVGFDCGGIAGVLGQDIEMSQVAAGTVEEEAEHLLEKLLNGRALGMLAHGTEKTVDVWEEVNTAQVADEEVEPGAARQAIARDLDIIDEFCFFGFAIGHPALHHMGEMIFVVGWIRL
jgi:hypothetical protein